MTKDTTAPKRAPRQPRCKSCRWWERSFNFKTYERDWGLCHFWGRRAGANVGNAFIDFTVGHEPRGCCYCGFHNADPSLLGQIPKDLAPKMMAEGEFEPQKGE